MANIIAGITPARLQKLERAGGIVLSEQAGLELDEAVREFKKTFEDSEAWSRKSVDATKRFARFGSPNALRNLMLSKRAFVLVVYETLLESGAQHVDAEARAAEIEQLIRRRPKEAADAARDQGSSRRDAPAAA